jgi:hypothetical protein
VDEIDTLADEIASIATGIDVAEHAFLTRLRRFDEIDGWGRFGCLSCAHWLSWRVGMSLDTAHEKVRVAHALAKLPKIDDAFRRGQLSYSKARAVTRVATPKNEEKLLETALAATAAQGEKIFRALRRVNQTGPESPEDQDDRRWVRRSDTESGMVRIDAQLRPEEAAVVFRAIEAAQALAVGKRKDDPSAEGSRTGRAARFTRADALVAVAETFLAREAPERVAGQFEVQLHLERDDDDGNRGTRLEDGTPLSAEGSRRIACDAPFVSIVDGPDGAPVSVGRRTRRISPALFRALRARDGGCRFPGCSNRIFVDAHHMKHWLDGGETKLDNTVLLCRRHHVFVHESGWSASLEDGRVAVRDQWGKIVPEAPARAPPIAVPRPADIDPQGALARDGRRMDFAWAVTLLADQP